MKRITLSIQVRFHKLQSVLIMHFANQNWLCLGKNLLSPTQNFNLSSLDVNFDQCRASMAFREFVKTQGIYFNRCGSEAFAPALDNRSLIMAGELGGNVEAERPKPGPQ